MSVYSPVRFSKTAVFDTKPFERIRGLNFMDKHIIEKLYEVLEQRKDADPETSYVAKLYEGGAEKISRKVMEEALETVLEAVKGDSEKLAAESADLLFHLMVLWAQQGVKPAEVFAILEERLGTSGHAEKAARKS